MTHARSGPSVATSLAASNAHQHPPQQQPGRRLETATVEINGGLYDVARQTGEPLWRGDLHGEDADTGEVWRMGFWLPDAAVQEMAVRA